MSRTLVTMASWEERFLLGLERNLDPGVGKAIVLWSERYAADTEEARRKAGNLTDIEDVSLNVDDPVACWRGVSKRLASLPDGAEVLLDITTMPREIIWVSLWALENRHARVTCVYYPPEKYGPWLTKDPGEPRLVYKLGGELAFGQPTKLLVISGYEEHRIRQLIQRFEPVEVLVGYHDGSTVDNPPNTAIRKDAFKDAEALGLSDFPYDAVADDWGFTEIESNSARPVSECECTDCLAWPEDERNSPVQAPSKEPAVIIGLHSVEVVQTWSIQRGLGRSLMGAYWTSRVSEKHNLVVLAWRRVAGNQPGRDRVFRRVGRFCGGRLVGHRIGLSRSTPLLCPHRIHPHSRGPQRRRDRRQR